MQFLTALNSHLMHRGSCRSDIWQYQQILFSVFMYVLNDFDLMRYFGGLTFMCTFHAQFRISCKLDVIFGIKV